MRRLGWETDLEAQGLVIGLGAWGWGVRAHASEEGDLGIRGQGRRGCRQDRCQTD